MRIALLSANKRTETGEVRALMRLAGRSVLAWQVDCMRTAGAERILCLAQESDGEVLRIQHEAERAGLSFHVLRGFAAVPALVRADDELMVLCDGLLPDASGIARLSAQAGSRHFVASLPDGARPATGYPDDFERIDAASLWAGFLVMRGAGAARLSDFPADADAISLLLRLALQAHTPRREVDLQGGSWLLATSGEVLTAYEKAMIAQSAPAGDWRTPSIALASVAARRFARSETRIAPFAGAGAAVLLPVAAATAIYGAPAAALLTAAAGLFAAEVWKAGNALTARLRGREPQSDRRVAALADFMAALVLYLTLAHGSAWSPLAICGPLLIGLARLAEEIAGKRWAALAKDRTALVLTLSLAAFAGVLSGVTAVLAALLMIAVLMRQSPE